MNGAKTWLIVKKEVESEARNLFQGSQINITTVGRCYLGAPISTEAFIEDFVRSKVESWRSVVVSLTEAAFSSSHAAYAASPHGIMSLWLFLCRTTPNISHLLAPLEDVITTRMIPVLTGQTFPGDLKRSLFALPVRLGGLNFASPTSPTREYGASVNLSSPLSSLLLDQSPEFSMDVLISQERIRSIVCQNRRNSLNSTADTLMSELPKDLHHVVSLAQEKGTS